MSMDGLDDDGEEKDETKRKSRNLSEKKRRDEFNRLVVELGTMVSPNNRKMDKTTVLKTSISFLKQHNEMSIRSQVNHMINLGWRGNVEVEMEVMEEEDPEVEMERDRGIRREPDTKKPLKK